MSMSVKDKARLYRELGKLLAASFPMDKAIALLLEQASAGGTRELLQGLTRGLEQRQGFAEALRRQSSGQAGEMELSLLDSGEKSGRLAEACEHLAHYFETWDKGLRAARGALVYPLVLLHAGILLPEISRHALLSNLPGHEASAGVLPAVLLQLSVFWGMLALLWYAWRALNRAAVNSASVDRALNWLPLIASVRRHWALARFCQVFHSALLAALRISECLRLAGEASQSGTLRAGAIQAAASVEQGSTLAEGLAKSPHFPRLFAQSITTAEVSGGLDREFARWAQAETDLAGEAQNRAAEWYPKLLYFFILGYIAFRIVGMMSQYYGALAE